MASNDMESAEKEICCVCAIDFPQVAYLKAHTKEFHSDEFDLIFGATPQIRYIALSKVNPENTCGDCGNIFSKYFNLRIHVKRFHGVDRLDAIAPKKIDNHGSEEGSEQFSPSVHFQTHQKQHQHTTAMSDEKYIKCPLCPYQSIWEASINGHFQTVHDMKVEIDKIEFSKLVQFLTWKKTMERNTGSFFSAMYSEKNADCTESKFVCHRSGCYVRTDKGLQHIQTHGTNRIDGFCPASLLVTSKGGKYTVYYTKTHVGHEYILRLDIPNSDTSSLELDTHNSAKEEEYSRLCEICGKHFSDFLKFKSHHKQHTTKCAEKSVKPSVKCPLCSHTDVSDDGILLHFKNDHDVEVESEDIEFPMSNQFLIWKTKIEETTKSFFTVVYTINYGNCTKSKYRCHRSGCYTPKGTVPEMQINGFCPANLLVTTNDGKYTVRYTKTHVGHDFSADVQNSEEEADSCQSYVVVCAETAEDIDLDAEKTALIASLSQIVGKISCVEGLDVVKRIVASMNPVVDAVQSKIGKQPS